MANPRRNEVPLPLIAARDGVMHACGHDGHTHVIALATAYYLQHRDNL